MNRSRSTSILSISIGAILVIGAIAPALTQQAYGQLVTIGSVSTMEDLNAPTYRGNPGWFVFSYEDLSVFGDQGTNDCADADGTVELNTFTWIEPFPNAIMGGAPPANSITGIVIGQLRGGRAILRGIPKRCSGGVLSYPAYLEPPSSAAARCPSPSRMGYWCRRMPRPSRSTNS